MPIAATGLTTGDFANTLRHLPSCLDKFEALGVESVELSLAAFDIIAGAKLLPHRLAELKRICAGRPFKFTVHGPIASSFTDRRHLSLQKDVCRAVQWTSAAATWRHRPSASRGRRPGRRCG